MDPTRSLYNTTSTVIRYGTSSQYSPKTECGCLYGGVIENGRARNPLTLCNVPVLVHVQVWVHVPGDPQSVELRNATTTTSSQSQLFALFLQLSPFFWVTVVTVVMLSLCRKKTLNVETDVSASSSCVRHVVPSK